MSDRSDLLLLLPFRVLLVLLAFLQVLVAWSHFR